MKPQHVVTILATAIAVLVIAGFLIAIIIELRKTYMQLVTILGAVAETADKTEGLDSVVAGLADDLAAGQAAFTGGVDRLEQRLSESDDEPPPGWSTTGTGGSVRA